VSIRLSVPAWAHSSKSASTAAADSCCGPAGRRYVAAMLLHGRRSAAVAGSDALSK